MNIGRRIKRAFGHVNSVDYVSFSESEDHIIAIVTTYNGTITHKEVNDVLNKYPLGHWIFIESRIDNPNLGWYRYNGKNPAYGEENVLVSVYRVNKKDALEALKLAEETKTK